jgi:hypothetical protein
VGWVQRPSASSFKHRRQILRGIGRNANAYANCICDADSYADRDTHVYAETNTYTKGSSDSERPANTAPASVVRLNAQPGIPLGILSFVGKMAAAADWQRVPMVAGKAAGGYTRVVF